MKVELTKLSSRHGRTLKKKMTRYKIPFDWENEVCKVVRESQLLPEIKA